MIFLKVIISVIGGYDEDWLCAPVKLATPLYTGKNILNGIRLDLASCTKNITL